MLKRDLLKHYTNQEDKMLIAQVLDKLEFCKKRNKIEHTDFLDIAQIGKIEKILKKMDKQQVCFYGGFSEAERKMLFLYPKKLMFLFETDNNQYDIFFKVLRITLPKEQYEKYKHQNYLGAIMKIRN